MKLYYPAIFLKENDGRYSVSFSDVLEAIICGRDFENVDIKETVVFYTRNKKTGLCFTFAVDEEKEEFVLYYIYQSESHSLPDDEKDTREIFKKYKFDEYVDLLDTIKDILNGFKIKSLIELKGVSLKIKIVEG